MAPNLIDIALLRQGELTRQLADCAAIDPSRVLPAIFGKLQAADLTDERARVFILTLQANYDELAAAEVDIDHLAELVLDIAIADVGICDYLGYMVMVSDIALNIATEAITEIQKLVISRETLDNLADYAADVEERSRYK